MRRGTDIQAGWTPLLGSYEEAVLTWQEQVENAFAQSRDRDVDHETAQTREGEAHDRAPSAQPHAGELLP